MSHLESMMSFYRSELSDKIKKLSAPLDTTFGLDVFWYHVNTADGLYSFAGNCADITEFYYGNDLHHHNPFLRHPDNYRTGAALPFCTPDPEYLRTQLATHDQFGMGKILLLMVKEDSICHHFGFASTKNSVPMDVIYLEHLPLLFKFRDYFLKEWSSYRRRMQRHTLKLADIIGPKYYEVNDSKLGLISESQKRLFLEQIGKDQKPYSQNESLCVYKKTVDAIEANLFSSIDLKRLSKLIGASPTTLMRHFKSETNETICSYIRRRRLHEAMNLLMRGTFSVSEVASMVGYSNFGAFTEAFKVQFKKPPSHFSKGSKL